MSSLDDDVDLAEKILDLSRNEARELLQIAASAKKDLIKVTAWSCVKEFVDDGTIPANEMMEAMSAQIHSTSPRVAQYLSQIFFEVAMRSRSFEFLARFLAINPGACISILENVGPGGDATRLVAQVIIEASSRSVRLRPLVEAIADLLRMPQFFRITMDAISSLVEETNESLKNSLACELALAVWAYYIQGLEPPSQLDILTLVPHNSKFHAAFADRLLSGAAAVAA